MYYLFTLSMDDPLSHGAFHLTDMDVFVLLTNFGGLGWSGSHFSVVKETVSLAPPANERSNSIHFGQAVEGEEARAGKGCICGRKRERTRAMQNANSV